MKQIFALAALLTLAVPTGTATSQTHETNAAFEAGQSARAEAGEAFRAGNLKAALTKMEEALTHRPGNTALLSNILFLAAETGDLVRAEEAALEFAAQGLAPGANFQAKLREKLAPETWARLEEKFLKNTSPKGDAEILTEVPAEAMLVEGIALNQTDGSLFAATVVSRAIYKIADGETNVFVDGKPLGMPSFFGIAFDDARRSLFATYARVDQTPGIAAGEGHTGIAEFDAATGALKKNWVLDGSTTDHQIADIVITHAHEIYASDATGKAVYRIEGDRLVKAFDLPFAMSPQGIAELDGGLYLADYGRGIWHLDRTSDEARLLAVPKHTNLLGIDGLAAHKGNLVAIQNGTNPHRIIEIAVDHDEMAVTSLKVLAQALDGFDEPTLGTSTGDGYYFVASSQWPKYAPGGTVREGVQAKPTKIMKLR
jgi:hypothetical protein